MTDTEIKRRLTGTVTVQRRDKDGKAVGDPQTFARHTVPPADWAELITNPSAWEPIPVDETATVAAPVEPVNPPPKRARKAPTKKAAAKKATSSGGDEGDLTPPAADADRDEWAAYATKVGVTFDADAGGDAIIAAVRDAGLLEQ